MHLTRWLTLQNLIGKESPDKNLNLLNVALCVLRDDADDVAAAFIMRCVRDSDFVLPSLLDKPVAASDVARDSTGAPQLAALKFFVDEFKGNGAGFTKQECRKRFDILEDVVAGVIRAGFQKKDLELYLALVETYLREAENIAGIDKPHAVRSLLLVQAMMPEDISAKVKNDIREAIFRIATDSAEGGTAQLRTLPRGPQAGREALAET